MYLDKSLKQQMTKDESKWNRRGTEFKYNELSAYIPREKADGAPSPSPAEYSPQRHRKKRQLSISPSVLPQSPPVKKRRKQKSPIELSDDPSSSEDEVIPVKPQKEKIAQSEPMSEDSPEEDSDDSDEAIMHQNEVLGKILPSQIFH